MALVNLEETRCTQDTKLDCTIDITTIEASDSVQSHLSTSTSSKRPIRIPNSTPPDAAGPALSLDSTGVHSGDHSLLQWVVASARYLTSPASPILPTTGRISTHLDRPRTIGKWLLVVYCFVSCVTAGSRIYAGLFIRKETGIGNTEGLVAFESPPGNANTVAQYLTRQVATATLEPFVLSNGTNARPNVTICAWLRDSELDLLEGWMQSSAASLSLLIATTAPISSLRHRRLLETFKHLLPAQSIRQVSIHLLHIRDTDSIIPNLYLNLARLYAAGAWTMLVPGRPPNEPYDFGLNEHNSSINLKARTGAHVLSSQGHTYPFPDLSPLLIRKDNNFWCTERFFAGNSRSHDWNECLWQLHLEMTGKIAVIDVPKNSGEKAMEERQNDLDDIVRQRLAARFRAEKCDTFLKRISGLYPRTRHRNMEIEWVKTFCTKTVDRKMAR